MRNRLNMKKIILLLMLGTLASCSKTYYKDATSTHIANLSFTNLASNSAEVNIIYDCHRTPIERNRLERKQAHAAAQKFVKVQADKILSIEFKHYTIGAEKSSLITYGGSSSRNLVSTPTISSETRKDLDVCSSYVNFIPKKNKNYELILRSQANKCRVEVRESLSLDNSKKRKLSAIKHSTNNLCK